MSTDKSKHDPAKAPDQNDAKTPGTEKSATEPDRELTDSELGKVSGGAGRAKWGDIVLKRG
jgi:hypothetical protein